MTTAEQVNAIAAEYQRCLRIATGQEPAPALFGVGPAEARRYYAHRAEGLGYALDRLAAPQEPER